MEERTRRIYKLAKAIKKFFPGYQITGIDPGIKMTRWEKHDSGRSTAVDTLYLSVMAAECLLTHKVPKRITRKDM